MNIRKILAGSIASLIALAAVSVQAQSFSVAPGGPSGLIPDDVHTPASPPPPVTVSGAAGGLDVNAISFGRSFNPHGSVTTYEFSVDPASVGAGGTAVNAESAANDQPADIYNSQGNNNNFLSWDGDGNSGPTMGLQEQPQSDDTDAWDMRSAGVNPPTPPNIFFSFSGGGRPGGTSSADIFVNPTVNGYDGGAPPSAFAPAGMLGLDQNGMDDIDALVVFDLNNNLSFDGNDVVLFSLIPNSPAFTAGGLYNGLSPADVLYYDNAAATGGLFAPASTLGLLSTDNMDALDVVPEPNVIASVVLGAAGFIFVRRRFMM